MPFFRRILFVYDAHSIHDAAFDQALTLARSHRAQLTVLELKRGGASPGESAVGLVARRTAANDSVDIRPRVVSGSPWAQIAREADNGGHDLVIVPDGGTKPAPASAIAKLVRNCAASAWIARPGGSGVCRSIVAAVDCVRDGSGILNRKILEVAKPLARSSEGSVHIVHGWHLPGEEELRSPLLATPPPQLRELLHNERNRHLAGLHGTLEEVDFGSIPIALHLRKGKHCDAITRVANQQDADLVIVGFSGRAGLPALLFGTTAEELITRTTRSLLIVKAASPVVPAVMEARAR